MFVVSHKLRSCVRPCSNYLFSYTSCVDPTDRPPQISTLRYHNTPSQNTPGPNTGRTPRRSHPDRATRTDAQARTEGSHRIAPHTVTCDAGSAQVSVEVVRPATQHRDAYTKAHLRRIGSGAGVSAPADNGAGITKQSTLGTHSASRSLYSRARCFWKVSWGLTASGPSAPRCSPEAHRGSEKRTNVLTTVD